MSGGFFGFDTALPDRKAPAPSQPPQPQAQGRFGGFSGSSANDAFGGLGAGAQEDVAVYTWGQGIDQSLLDDGDDLNDETFGALGDIGHDFQFEAPAAPAPKKPAGGPKIASTASRYGPKKVADPFAMSEDDFYSSRATKAATAKPVAKPKKATPVPKPAAAVDSLWDQPAAPSAPMWGAAPSSVVRPQAAAPPNQAFVPPANRPAGHIKTLEEIEAEMAGIDLQPPAPAQSAAPQHKIMSLEEIEAEMMSTPEPVPQPPQPQPLPQPQPQLHPPPSLAQVREDSQTTVPLAGSGYASGQALLDSMFPQLGAGPGGPTGSLLPPDARPSQPSPDEMARLEALQKHIAAKIESMSRYNHLMGSSDKDFITRMQLSQLVTADPYASDFYAQVFSAVRRSQQAAEQAEAEARGVVNVGPNAGLGVSGPAGNRFGKMGSNTMTRLSTQVKRLVDSRAAHQKNANADVLKGALGKVSRKGIAAPRPVLAVPAGSRPDHRPVNALNQQTGVTRPALTKKQAMFALEELYELMLELEQLRRDQPAEPQLLDQWNQACQIKVNDIWRRLMVMEPLDVSNPHPFISLLNPIKGQRLFPRILRCLPHSQALTLLTLLIATYPQLDVVAHAPPPPIAEASMLALGDRADRARREAETDSFLHCVVPGMDVLINTCHLGLVAGLLNICTQRMPDLKAVASTRPGVALFTALLSKAQTLVRIPQPDASNPNPPPGPDAAEIEHWQRTFAYFLQTILPSLPELFPSSVAQKAAFGPGAYLLGGDTMNERDGLEMERREAEVWGLAAALAVNAPEEEQTNLVATLREKILHTVQGARNRNTPPSRAELKLRNVNMFLHALGLDASMIE